MLSGCPAICPSAPSTRHCKQDVQQKAAGGASAARYGHCTARQGAQLEQDAADRRQRQVQRLPRLYRLVAPLPVPEAPPPAQAAALLAAAPQLQHLGTLRREGQPPAFALPAEPALINSSLRYLPCTMEGAAAGAADAAGAAGNAAAGRSGTAGGSSRGSGAPRVYSKQAVPPLADDPLLPQLVQQAQQAAAASGTAAGGEGAEGQEAPPPPPPPAEADAGAEGQPLFCVAGSAFVALASAPMLRCAPAWEIPVTILPADEAADVPAGGGSGGGSGDGGSGGTVVCLEKPLLQRLMSMRAKQQRLQKYAVLSMGLQQPAAASQQAQQAQQPTPRRRTRSSLAAAASAEGGDAEAPTAAAAAANSAPAPGPGLPHREAAYDCWQLGSCRLLVRSHGRLQLLQQQDAQQQQEEQQQQQQQGGVPPPPPLQQQQQAEPGGQHVVLGLKTEYLPDPDRGT